NLAQRLLLSGVKLYSWARDDASVAELNELTLMLGAGDLADTARQTSAAFVLALLGNVKARRALLESVSEGLSPREAKLVGLAGTFNRMDARIGAGKAGKFGES